MWSPSPCLNKLATSHKLKNVAPLGFYALRRNWPRVPEMVWDATCNWAYNEKRDSD
jgi:hypothetical protein